MEPFFTIDQYDQAAALIRSRINVKPRIALILGSGLGEMAGSIQNPVVIPFSDIPNMPVSTVQGHAGRLIAGTLEDQPVMVMQGRIHFYEGYNMAQVTFPIRIMQRLGVEILIVTNAAGAVHPDFLPGDLMLILDHLNMVGMIGFNPLFGPNLDPLGERFPDMSQAYDRKLHDLARRVAQERSIVLREGVYAGLSGPSFETPAELRYLRLVGADSVGMSTVSEVTAARHGGIRVMGISCISNKANLDGGTLTSHAEVLEAGKILAPKLEKLLRGILKSL